MTQAPKHEHYVAPVEENSVFDELPDAIPRRRYRPSVAGWIGFAVTVFWLVVALIGPSLAPFGENDLPLPDAYSEFQAPQPGVWLGTDVEDRDTLSRLVHGARRTIGISLMATLLAYAVGVFFGIGAAVSSPRVDMILSRVNDAFLSLPTIMLGLVAVAALGSSIPVLILSAGLIFSSAIFRLSRAIGMEVAVMDYVEAARVRGEGRWWIITQEIWPNVKMPLYTDFGLRLIYVILFVSSLSFLGLGVQPPAADWGSMVRENLGALQYGESLLAVLAPAFAIATLTVGINLLVDDVSAKTGSHFSGKM